MFSSIRVLKVLVVYLIYKPIPHVNMLKAKKGQEKKGSMRKGCSFEGNYYTGSDEERGILTNKYTGST